MAIKAQLCEDWCENHYWRGAFYNDNTLFTGDKIGAKYGCFTGAQIGEVTGDFGCWWLRMRGECGWMIVVWRRRVSGGRDAKTGWFGTGWGDGITGTHDPNSTPFPIFNIPRYGLKSLGFMRVFGECYLPLLGSIRVLEIWNSAWIFTTACCAWKFL